jgi:hypothetical protein
MQVWSSWTFYSNTKVCPFEVAVNVVNLAQLDNAVVLTLEPLLHLDGLERARSWLRGTVVTSPNTRESVTTEGLELKLVGMEAAATSACPTAMKRLRMTSPIHPLALKIPLKTRNAIILSKRQVLHAFTSDERPTIYPTAYSFAIFLPTGLPPTMQCYNRETGGHCSVAYTLTATAILSVVQEDDNFAEAMLKTQTIKTHCNVNIVGEPFPSLTYPHGSQPSCLHIKQSMFRLGSFNVTARTENTQMRKDESVSFALAFVNKAQHCVERVKLSLIERITWITGLNKGANSRRFKAECKVVLQSCTKWFPIGLQIDNIMLGSHGRRNQVTVHVPRIARASYHGVLIQVSHYIQVELVVEGVSYQDYPKLCIPILVSDPPVHDARTSPPMHGVFDTATK